MKKRFIQIRDSIKVWYDGLSQKERLFVIIFLSVLFAVIVVSSIIMVSSALNTRYMDIADKEKKLQDIISYRDKYREAEQSQKIFEQRLKSNNVNLFSFVEELSRKLQIDIVDMNERTTPPQKENKIQEQTLELNITKVSMDRLVDFMKELEKSQYLIKIKKLKVNTRYEKDARMLNVNMIVATYKPISKE